MNENLVVFELQAKLCQVLAHPLRLRIINILKDGVKPVNEIVSIVVFLMAANLFVSALAQEPSSAISGRDKIAKTLRLRFEKGAVFRVNELVVAEFTNPAGEKTVNREECQFTWTVKDVSADGIAHIVVKFDRVKWNLERPVFDFDSRVDNGTTEPREPVALRALAFKARTLANVEFIAKVNRRGGVVQLLGGQSVEQPIRYTPGDWPALPVQSVTVGDSWIVDSLKLAGGVTGTASYRVESLKQADDHQILTLVGESKWNVADNAFPGKAKMLPVESTSQFDADEGRFINEKTNGEIQAELDTGQITKAKTETERSINVKEENVESVKHKGDNLIIFKDGKQTHVMIAGKEQVVDQSLKDDVRKLLRIEFFNLWDDNGDEIPSIDELSGSTNRFTANERIYIHFSIFGLPNSKLRFEMLDQAGTTVISNSIPIKGPAAMAFRQVGPADAGVYFFVFYLDDKHVLRVPVQVFGSEEVAKE